MLSDEEVFTLGEILAVLIILLVAVLQIVNINIDKYDFYFITINNSTKLT